jgi:hypothetical protein
VLVPGTKDLKCGRNLATNSADYIYDVDLL